MERLERLIGYRFRNRDLLVRALKHRSVLAATGEPRVRTNERLEFLGDAVLDLVVREELLQRFPRAREGQLTRLKSLQVSGRQLTRIAREMELGAYLQMSDGEQRSGGRTRASILEDALEALIGAIYLDGGLPAAKRFIDRFIASRARRGRESARDRNYKSLLLEYVQSRGISHPVYRVVSERGPDHEKTFTIEVLIGGVSYGRGGGRSKKRAEQIAAREALLAFHDRSSEHDENDAEPSGAGSEEKGRADGDAGGK